MGDVKLKPCPLCGGDVTTYIQNSMGQTLYGVMCKNTGCALIPPLYPTEEQAAELWNKRIAEQPITFDFEKVIEQLKKEKQPECFADPFNKRWGVQFWNGALDKAIIILKEGADYE